MLPTKELGGRLKWTHAKRHCTRIVEEIQMKTLDELLRKELPTEEQIKNLGIDLVDEFFPKGECKERGKAIVLYAQLIIEVIKQIDLIKQIPLEKVVGRLRIDKDKLIPIIRDTIVKEYNGEIDLGSDLMTLINNIITHAQELIVGKEE